jgi:hypothetical protein
VVCFSIVSLKLRQKQFFLLARLSFSLTSYVVAYRLQMGIGTWKALRTYNSSISARGLAGPTPAASAVAIADVGQIPLLNIFGGGDRLQCSLKATGQSADMLSGCTAQSDKKLPAGGW